MNQSTSISKIVFITGATSGIGKACANKFAENGYNLIITGRRDDRLKEISLELEDRYAVKVLALCFDVQNRKEVEAAIAGIPLIWQQIGLLINNAGLALGKEPFDKADIDDWDTMVKTNVNGLLYVSRALLPFLKASREAQIINLGSVAGKEVYQNGNVYCGSKFAVDAITKAMRIDLLTYGIKVTGIHPGAVETEFSLVRFKGDHAKAQETYSGFTPLSPQDVADTIYYSATLPPHVCINDIIITPLQQADAYYFDKKQ